MEIGALDKDIGSSLRNRRVESTDNPCQGHRRIAAVADQQGVFTDFMLAAIEGCNPLSVDPAPHHNPPFGQEIVVEGMGGVPHLKEKVVGNIDHVIDRALANSLKPLPEPFGRLADLYPRHDPGRIARAGEVILHLDTGEG